MTAKYAAAISLLMALAAVPQARAASKEQRQITWEGLSALVGKQVIIVMPDGAQIEGKATAVEPDALAVEIHKTSNKSTYPKGQFLVPRATLRAVDVNHPTVKYRAICTSIGLGVGVFLGIAAKESTGGFINSTGAAAAFGAGAVGVPIAGYFIGRAGDRHTITYVIAP